MQRYIASKVKKENGVPKFTTTRLPVVPKTDQDLFIFTREGDRLDQLADQFYEEPRLWPYIAMANNLGKGSLAVPAGIQLRIPVYSTTAAVEELFIRAEEIR
tara:strand:+ start:753 stop:1058 length:306 start_codon:yes stop_codon:yes gene_type:complete